MKALLAGQRNQRRERGLLVRGELTHRLQRNVERRARRETDRDRGAAPRDEPGRGSRAFGACQGRCPARAATPGAAAGADAASASSVACCRSPRAGSGCPAVSASAAEAPAGVSDASHSVRNPPVRAGSAWARAHEALAFEAAEGGLDRLPVRRLANQAPQRPPAAAQRAQQRIRRPPDHRAGRGPRRSTRSAARSRPRRTAGLPTPARRQARRGSSRLPTGRDRRPRLAETAFASRTSMASRTPSGSGPSAGPTTMPVTVRRPSGTSTRAPRTAPGRFRREAIREERKRRDRNRDRNEHARPSLRPSSLVFRP